MDKIEFLRELDPDGMSSLLTMNPEQKLLIFTSEMDIPTLEAGLEALKRGRETYLQAVQEGRLKRDMFLLRANKEVVEKAEEHLQKIKTQKILETPVSEEEMKALYSNKYIPQLSLLVKRLTLRQKYQIFKDLYPKWKKLYDQTFSKVAITEQHIFGIGLEKKEKKEKEKIENIFFELLRSEGKRISYADDCAKEFSNFYNEATQE